MEGSTYHCAQLKNSNDLGDAFLCIVPGPQVNIYPQFLWAFIVPHGTNPALSSKLSKQFLKVPVTIFVSTLDTQLHRFWVVCPNFIFSVSSVIFGTQFCRIEFSKNPSIMLQQTPVNVTTCRKTERYQTPVLSELHN